MSKFGLSIPPREKYDVVTLGGMTIREDPGSIPYGFARGVELHVSGGEYNVAAGLAKCFGYKTAHATPLIDSHEGTLVRNRMDEMRVDGLFRPFPFDGVLGPFYARTMSDRGWPGRPPTVQYRRANEAAALLKPGDFDWDTIFDEGVRWVHTGGIFLSLSETSSALAIEMFQKARARGIVTSLDLNYRGLLWQALRGGREAARAVYREIVALTDVLIGNETDLQNGLGIKGPDVERASEVDPAPFEGVMGQLMQTFPNVKVAATTLRSSGVHFQKWSAVMSANGQCYRVPVYDLEVMDRIGGGDGFGAGLFYGILENMDPETALRYGWAHGALVATTPGDTTMATLRQVQAFVEGQSQRVTR
jgi:2-dehydro-3-deoxygluconokinase